MRRLNVVGNKLLSIIFERITGQSGEGRALRHVRSKPADRTANETALSGPI